MVTIIDKINNKKFKNCNRFVDGGEAGDEYTYSPPLNDEIIISQLNNISTKDVGPAEATLKVSGKLMLPVGLKSGRKSREDKQIECPIESEVKLFSEIRRIEFKTKFDNKVSDHRLRVEFPTNIKTDYVYADGHFEVVKRSVNIPDSEGWKEKAYKTAHNSGFVDINNKEYGLAVLNRGLPEYEIMPDNNTIALTLLRCVGCHQGSWDDARISQKTKQYKAKVLTKQLKNQPGNLSDKYSFIQLEGKHLEISAIKKHEFEDKLLIRVYNPIDRNITGKIKLGFDIHKVYLGRLDESYKEELPYNDGVEIVLKPKEIKTIIFEVLLYK